MSESKTDSATSFGLSAAGYAHARRGYPDEIFETILSAAPGRASALDLGAGSGQATGPLAARFDKVIAVEPDARLTAEGNFPSNVTVVNEVAEAADFSDDSFDAIISATAFHWMDQSGICEAATCWLKPGGIFFPFAYGTFDYPEPMKPLEAAEQEKWTPYKDRRLLENYDYPPILERSGAFASVRPYEIVMRKDYTPRDAACLMATTSFGSAYARDQEGGVDAYIERLTAEIATLMETVAIGFPIIGAIGARA